MRACDDELDSCSREAKSSSQVPLRATSLIAVYWLILFSKRSKDQTCGRLGCATQLLNESAKGLRICSLKLRISHRLKPAPPIRDPWYREHIYPLRRNG